MASAEVDFLNTIRRAGELSRQAKLGVTSDIDALFYSAVTIRRIVIRQFLNVASVAERERLSHEANE